MLSELIKIEFSILLLRIKKAWLFIELEHNLLAQGFHYWKKKRQATYMEMAEYRRQLNEAG